MDLTTFEFVYNANAHFAAVDKYPDGMVKALMDPGKAGFLATCWVLAEMAAQAELVRRDMGYDKATAPTEAHFAAHLMPRDMGAVRALILDRIHKGLRGDAEAEDEVDEVLAEIEKKADGD